MTKTVYSHFKASVLRHSEELPYFRPSSPVFRLPENANVYHRSMFHVCTFGLNLTPLITQELLALTADPRDESRLKLRMSKSSEAYPCRFCAIDIAT